MRKGRHENREKSNDMVCVGRMGRSYNLCRDAVIASLGMHSEQIIQGEEMRGTIALPTPKYLVVDPKGTHRYKIQLPSGEVLSKLDSVTGILGNTIRKPALEAWKVKTALALVEEHLSGFRSKNIEITDSLISDAIAAGKKRPQEIADEAADIGIKAHDAFEAILNGRTFSVPDEIVYPVAEFHKWFDGSKIQVIATELMVGSATRKYGGKLDALAIRNGKWGILDWKTGSGIYPEMALQVAGGYAHAVEEQYGIIVEWADICRFSKKEPYGCEVKPVHDIHLAMRGFTACLDLKQILDSDLFGPTEYTTFTEGE